MKNSTYKTWINTTTGKLVTWDFMDKSYYLKNPGKFILIGSLQASQNYYKVKLTNDKHVIYRLYYNDYLVVAVFSRKFAKGKFIKEKVADLEKFAKEFKF